MERPTLVAACGHAQRDIDYLNQADGWTPNPPTMAEIAV